MSDVDFLTEIVLFAGDGGGLLATQHLIGTTPICYIEIGKLQQKTLIQRIEDGLLSPAPLWDNVKTFNGKPYRNKVDIISAGFPCQPYSSAGLQLGDEDSRNLWPDTIRIIRETGTPWVILENVTGLLQFDYYGRILADLAKAGYDARWCCVSAFDVGAPHPRERLWIVANAYGGRRIAEKGIRKVQTAQQRRLLDRCTWWEAEPEIRRVDDGLARGVGRQLEPLGEGICPHAMAEAFLRMVSET